MGGDDTTRDDETPAIGTDGSHPFVGLDACNVCGLPADEHEPPARDDA